MARRRRRKCYSMRLDGPNGVLCVIHMRGGTQEIVIPPGLDCTPAESMEIAQFVRERLYPHRSHEAVRAELFGEWSTLCESPS